MYYPFSVTLTFPKLLVVDLSSWLSKQERITDYSLQKNRNSFLALLKDDLVIDIDMCTFHLSSLYYQEGYESDVEEPNDDISFLEALRQQSPPRQTDINMSTEDESEYEPGNSYFSHRIINRFPKI